MTNLPEQPADALDENDDPYQEKRDKPKYDKRPHSIYFYYFYRHEDTYRTRHYYLDNVVAVQRNDLEDIATNLALNARLPLGAQDPQPTPGSTPYQIKWKRKSYLIVLVDDPAYELAKHRAIKFEYQGGGGNHTFFDAKDLDIDLPRQQGGSGTERVSAVACLNHMKKDSGGDDLPKHCEQTFLFRLNPELEHRFYPDDGGTNAGPPIPPPPE